MDKIKQKKEERGEKAKAYDVLVKAAESGELTKEQKAQEETLFAEIEELDKEITQLERMEKSKASRAAAAVGAVQDNAAETKELSTIGKEFSIARAITRVQKGHKLEGAEREMHEIAQGEVSENGGLLGNIAIPEKFIQIGKRKVLTVGTEGTDVVYTDFGGLIPVLNPKPVTESMGVTTLQGLRGNVQMSRDTLVDTFFAFETETSDVDEITPTFDNIQLSPKRAGGYVDITVQMLKQSSVLAETHVRNKLNFRYGLTYDHVVLNATGSGNEPTGVFNISGTNVLSLGSGSANDMTYKALLSMRRDAEVANARRGTAGWLTNSYGEFALANTAFQASGVEGNFIYRPGSGLLLGEKFMTSNVVKADFSEGGQTDLCGIVYSSNWGGALVGTWGGLDILYDPYTQALGGKIRLVCNMFIDSDFEQAAEFSICKDWDATDLPVLT